MRSYTDKHKIVIADFPGGGLPAVIAARNAIVHRGVYRDINAPEQADLWEHISIARELVIRIFLNAIGFRGVYWSQLHKGRPLSFPACEPPT